jgi:hypothetical protein
MEEATGLELPNKRCYSSNSLTAYSSNSLTTTWLNK